MLGEWGRRIWYLLNRRRIERELEAEMTAHREMMGDRRAFGNVLKLREQSRDVWGWGWLDRAVQDLRHAVRVLRRTPAFSMTAVLILSAGIGLNLTFFHLLNVTALQPLAIKDPSTLVRFSRVGKTFFSSAVPYPATQYIRRHNSVLSAVLALRSVHVVWEDAADRPVPASFVSANWFAELGYGASLGRVFSEEVDERPDAPPGVVISHDFWRTRLGGDPQIVGRQVRVNGRAATVLGVAPARFPDLELQHPRLWLPIDHIDYFEPGSTLKSDWAAHSTTMFGRLREGVSPAASQEGLKPTLAELARMRPTQFRPDERLEPATGSQRFRQDHDRRELLTIASLVGGLTLLVLLVASANLGNLVLSHAIGRVRELSVRAALGASRWRIMRHMLFECGVVAALGAAGGMGIGYVGARLFASMTEMPAYLDFTPDWRVHGAAFAVAFAAMLAFGLIPAWMVSRRDLIRAMKDGGQQTSAGLARARFRLALLGAQVLGSCALLIVAGSMVRGLQRLLQDDMGFAFDRVAVVDASIARNGIRGEEARAYWSAVAEKIAAHPDVEAVSLGVPAPLGQAISESTYPDTPGLRLMSLRVDPAFLPLLRIPLLAGRHFEPGDGEDVVIISRRAAMQMYGTLDVLGEGFPRNGTRTTIIGIVGDARLGGRRGHRGAEQYKPLGTAHFGEAALLVRSRTDPGGLVQTLRAAAAAQDGRVLPVISILANEYQQRFRAPRLASTIAGLVAALVLALACLGIFGVVAYAVRVRMKEIGIRRALGADAPRILSVLVRPLVWPAAIGMLLGSIAGVAASRLLSGEPFYFAAVEAPVPAAALVVFVVAGLAAALVPASRALSADAMRVLRHE